MNPLHFRIIKYNNKLLNSQTRISNFIKIRGTLRTAREYQGIYVRKNASCHYNYPYTFFNNDIAIITHVLTKV